MDWDSLLDLQIDDAVDHHIEHRIGVFDVYGGDQMGCLWIILAAGNLKGSVPDSAFGSRSATPRGRPGHVALGLPCVLDSSCLASFTSEVLEKLIRPSHRTGRFNLGHVIPLVIGRLTQGIVLFQSVSQTCRIDLAPADQLANELSPSRLACVTLPVTTLAEALERC